MQDISAGAGASQAHRLKQTMETAMEELATRFNDGMDAFEARQAVRDKAAEKWTERYDRQEEALMKMHDSIAAIRQQAFGMIKENDEKDAKFQKRVTYLFQEFDGLKLRYETDVPAMQSRVIQAEARLLEHGNKFLSLEEKIPPDA